MKRSKVVALLIAALLVGGATASAGGRYLITSTRQIKPSVIRGIVGHTPVAKVEYIEGAATVLPPGEVGSAKADCPPYSHALSGGGYGSIAGIDAMEVGQEGAFIVTSNKTPVTLEIHATVVCAPVGGAVVSSRGDAKLRAAEQAAVRKVEGDAT